MLLYMEKAASLKWSGAAFWRFSSGDTCCLRNRRRKFTHNKTKIIISTGSVKRFAQNSLQRLNRKSSTSSRGVGESLHRSSFYNRRDFKSHLSLPRLKVEPYTGAHRGELWIDIESNYSKLWVLVDEMLACCKYLQRPVYF